MNDLSCMQTVLNVIPLFSKYLFLASYQQKTFNLGDKITEKGEPVNYLYVVGDKLR